MNYRTLLLGALIAAGLLAVIAVVRFRTSNSARVRNERRHLDPRPGAESPEALRDREERRLQVLALRAEVAALEGTVERLRHAPHGLAAENVVDARVRRTARQVANARRADAQFQVDQVKRFARLTAEQENELVRFYERLYPETAAVDDDEYDGSKARLAAFRDVLSGMLSPTELAAFDRQGVAHKKMFLDSLSDNLPDSLALTEVQCVEVRKLAERDSILADRMEKLLWWRVGDEELQHCDEASTTFRTLLAPSLSPEQNRILEEYLKDRIEQAREMRDLRRRLLSETR